MPAAAPDLPLPSGDEPAPDGRTAAADRGDGRSVSLPDVLGAVAREAGTAAGRVSSAAVNVRDRLWEGRLADTTKLPRHAVVADRRWTLHRYEPLPGAPTGVGDPVLLVPPLGAPDSAFDLRRGASLVGYLLGRGRTVFVVTYDAAFWRGRRRGLETWVDDVVPAAVARTAETAGAEHPDDDPDGERSRPVHLVGWSLGGLFALLATAAHPDLPVASVTAWAAPVDVSAVPIVAPFRSVAEYTGGQLFTTAYRVLGGFPAPAVRAAFQLVSVDRYLTKPVTILTHLDDRELLEQMEAVDEFVGDMAAYPGRVFGQIFHHVIRGNAIASDTTRIAGRPVRLADVTAPVLLVAGADDNIAPVRSVRHATSLLTSSSDLRFVVHPGGHLGVLTGRRARDTAWPDLLAFLTAHDDRGD